MTAKKVIKKRGNGDWVSDVQESFFWSGVVSFVMIFAFDLEFIEKGFGSYILLAKAVNTGVCLFFLIMGSKKTLNVLSQFLKFANAIKRGEEVEVVVEDGDEEARTPETEI
jgi:hypothetical protein